MSLSISQATNQADIQTAPLLKTVNSRQI